MFNIEVFPIAITKCNWKAYIDNVTDILGYSPTRGLDTIKLDINNPVAYLATLDLDNKPLEQLRNSNNSFDHFMVSVITVLDDSTILHLNITGLRVIHKEKHPNINIVILTGTMNEWLTALNYRLNKSIYHTVGLTLDACYKCFERLGFKEVLSNIKK